jgi:hypothetical protein
MTFERSHGKPRVIRARLTDLGRPVGGDAAAAKTKAANHGPDGRVLPGNRLGQAHGRKRAPASRELGLAADLDRALARDLTPDERARLTDRLGVLKDTLKLYAEFRRDLATDAPAATAAAFAFARETTVAAVLYSESIKTGLTSPRGLQLLEAAQKAEARSERASLHATTMADRFRRSERQPTMVEAHAEALVRFSDKSTGEGEK